MCHTLICVSNKKIVLHFFFTFLGQFFHPPQYPNYNSYRFNFFFNVLALQTWVILSVQCTDSFIGLKIQSLKYTERMKFLRNLLQAFYIFGFLQLSTFFCQILKYIFKVQDKIQFRLFKGRQKVLLMYEICWQISRQPQIT